MESIMKLYELFNKKLSKEEEEFGVDQDVVDDFDPNDDKFGNPSVGED